MVTLRADYDFHPDESTVRVFTTPASGVLQLDDDVAITETVESGVVLCHYAFGARWFKINVTTDLQGALVETGAAQQRFALNCDIATPMERDGDATFAVDLFVDVLVRADLRSIHVGDEDEFQHALSVGLVSPPEGEQARRGVSELLKLVQAGTLLPWLD
jgi:predicted RNA-binding protein associated with RNAse of E/G family